MSIVSVDNIQPIGSGTSVTVNSAATLVLNNANSTGVITATSFVGSGANLTSLPAANLTGTLPAISGANLTSLPSQVTIANNADNRVITGGSGTNLNGEANLTFNGITLEAESGSGVQVIRSKSGGSGGDYAIVEVTNSSTTRGRLVGDASVDAFRIDTAGGASTPITFLTGSSYTERLRIDQYGLVSAPFQYHLHAQRNSSQTGYNAGGAFGTAMIFNEIVSETKDSSLSSRFNTSNGLFTAPVTGLYLFNASAFGGSGNIFSQSWFTLNGGRAAGTDWVINSNYSFVQNTQVIRLSVGNTVGFKPYASGQSNVTIQANGNHTYFKVTLIG